MAVKEYTTKKIPIVFKGKLNPQNLTFKNYLFLKGFAFFSRINQSYIKLGVVV